MSYPIVRFPPLHALRPHFDKGDASEICDPPNDASPFTVERVSRRPDPVLVARPAGFGAESLPSMEYTLMRT